MDKALCSLLPRMPVRRQAVRQDPRSRDTGWAGSPQEPPACLVRQLEEPAARDVDIVVGTVAVVVWGLAPHLHWLTQLIHLLQPARQRSARNVLRHGGGRSQKEGPIHDPQPVGNPLYLCQPLIHSAHLLLHIHLHLAQLLHLCQGGPREGGSHTSTPGPPGY